MVHLRRLALTLTMTILILVTLFPSYVKADIQLSQEFVEPVKNWSFEDRDDSIPGDGVYSCPPWSSNNGGWRNVRGDLDGDGDCTHEDVILFSKAYIGDYDWHADFDGDGDVDYADIRIFCDSYISDKPRHLDRVYSWYTGGGGVVDGYEEGSESIYPSDDSYVDSVFPDLNLHSHETCYKFLAVYKYYPEGTLKLGRIWLKFSIPSGYTVTKAEVRLYQTEWSHYNNPVVTIHYSTDNSWSEEAITWNNQPTFGGALDSKTVEWEGERWLSWDVSSVVSGAGTFSFCLKTETSDTCAATFWSKDYDELDPYLYIEYSRPVYSYVMSQVLDSDTINAVKGKQITFAFWFLPEFVASDGSQNYARAEIHYSYIYDDPYHGPRTVLVKTTGDWVYPSEMKWHTAFVRSVTLPSNTDAVKVVIHGKPDFKAWIDQTSLSLSETKSVHHSNFKDCKLSLAVNLFVLKDISVPGYPIPNPYRAWIGVAMATHVPEWFLIIDYVELKVKLISGSSVTIKNVTQSNDVNYVTDPEQSEKIENKWIVAGQTVFKGLVAVGIWMMGTGLPTIEKLLLSLAGVGATSLLLPTYRSDADDPYANPVDPYARARINLAGQVHFATERCVLELAFGSTCQVEVTAKVKFWFPSTTPIPYELETSTLVTVSL